MSRPISPNLVETPNPDSARLRPTTPDYAEFGGLTRGGTIGSAARPAPTRAAAEGRATSSALSERLLLRGYGLDPDDLELEILERRR
jgi:hypothetical protein